MLRTTFAALLLGISACCVQASPINEADFTPAAELIDFESLARGVQITNQYQPLGVVFSGGFYIDPIAGSTLNGSLEGTNYTSSANIRNPIIATFTVPQLRAGAWMGQHVGGDGDVILLEAFLNGIRVDSARFSTSGTLPGGNISSVFAALQVPTGFDRLEFSGTTGNKALSVDDFRFEAVPEPASGVCALLGAACVIASRRRA